MTGLIVCFAAAAAITLAALIADRPPVDCAAVRLLVAADLGPLLDGVVA